MTQKQRTPHELFPEKGVSTNFQKFHSSLEIFSILRNIFFSRVDRYGVWLRICDCSVFIGNSGVVCLELVTVNKFRVNLCFCVFV